MELKNYLHCTEIERKALQVTNLHIGYICYQIDGIDGWYKVNTNQQWEFIGGRPPHRPNGYLR